MSDCRTSDSASNACGGLFWDSRAAPDQRAYITIDQDQLYQITLENPDLRLGDLWLAFGNPDNSGYLIPYDPTAHRVMKFTATLSFGRVTATVQVACPTAFATLFRARVSTLMLMQAPLADGGQLSELRSAFRAVCSQ